MRTLKSKKMLCPLCASEETSPFHRDEEREYLRCRVCSLIFVPAQYHLSREEEKKRYDHHQNAPDDKEYRCFLSRLFHPLQEKLSAGSCGLDFGSGPGPTLSIMFKEAGYPMTIYDTFYAYIPAALERQYDFITATEVLEHLREPKNELGRLWDCLRPGGTLGIMTKLAQGQGVFAQWHYKRDPTHICFYSQETFHWLASLWKATPTFFGDDVILLGK